MGAGEELRLLRGRKRGDAAIFQIGGPQPERCSEAHWELGRASSGRAPEHRKLHLLKAAGAQGRTSSALQPAPPPVRRVGKVLHNCR